MTPERKSDDFPDWARQERQADLEWIGENLKQFWPAARAGFAGTGESGALLPGKLTVIP